MLALDRRATARSSRRVPACGRRAPGTRGHFRLAIVLVGFACLAVPPASRSFEQFDPRSQTPLSDILEIVALPRSLLAIDATSGGSVEEDLELGETVLWQRTRGRVGAVVTDRRLLLVATNSGSWQSTRFGQGERPPSSVLLGDRVAAVHTKRRILGFDGGSGNLVESSLGPREVVRETAVGENVAVVLTDRRALGLSPFAGGFFPAPILLGERIESVEAKANLATITTQRRLLIFRAGTGNWEERRRDLSN